MTNNTTKVPKKLVGAGHQYDGRRTSTFLLLQPEPSAWPDTAWLVETPRPPDGPASGTMPCTLGQSYKVVNSTAGGGAECFERKRLFHYVIGKKVRSAIQLDRGYIQTAIAQNFSFTYPPFEPLWTPERSLQAGTASRSRVGLRCWLNSQSTVLSGFLISLPVKWHD